MPTSFDKGVARFTWLMIRFMAGHGPAGVPDQRPDEGHNWVDAFFFALAVAVGLTPEMLPMIVSVCLSRGAIAMSRKKVIVKRLNSIQNLGAMDVLCTDKTGTLTLDRVILERHCDVVRHEDDEVLMLAYLNSHFQTGLKNVLDRAILEFREIHEKLSVPDFKKVDEIPFDFSRKLMSVVVETPEGVHRLICKGATEAVFQRCNRFELEGKIYPDRPAADHGPEGGVRRARAPTASACWPSPTRTRSGGRPTPRTTSATGAKGYVAFLDPPKETAAPAIVALQNHGVTVKTLTGDNELVSRKICHEVGLPPTTCCWAGRSRPCPTPSWPRPPSRPRSSPGSRPATSSGSSAPCRARGTWSASWATASTTRPPCAPPTWASRSIRAVDIAKEAADIILLEKSLMVLEEGVLEGRKVFANILKYIRMGASSNFGNMFSVLGASAFLPFLPMEPIQILTNNLLYDFSQVPIPADDVDPEQIAKPRPWHMGEIARFILFIGPCSSIFDYTTYLMMLYLFGCWDSTASQRVALPDRLVRRVAADADADHPRHPHQPHPVPPEPGQLAADRHHGDHHGLGVWLPSSPIGLPGISMPLAGGSTGRCCLDALRYVLLTQGVKMWLIRKGWIWRSFQCSVFSCYVFGHRLS